MTYRSILVHLDDSARCAERVALAASVAHAQGAHLLGLAPTGMVHLPAGLQPTGQDGLPTLAAAREQLLERAEHCVQRFKQQVSALGLVSQQGRVHDDDMLSAVIQHARTSDLVVLGQHDPQHTVPLVSWDFPQQVCLHAGRPVLVLPLAGHFAGCGRTVVVGWNDSRESARALADALPLLQQAQDVHVLSFQHAGELDEVPPSLDGVGRWLQRQGVQATLHLEATALHTGDALLARAADLSADLIVMGGYGHRRITELVLGGVTRSMLATMTVPTLISH